MTFTEDRSAFFTDFAVAVTIGGVSGVGIFDKEYASFDMASGNRPALTVVTEDFPAVVEGSAVTITGEVATYTVAGTPQADGTGMSVLLLEKV